MREPPPEWDHDRPRYHGSPQTLTALAAGSTITQDADLARVFSHKPALVCLEDDGRLRHNGRLLGYLYRVSQPVSSDDVCPHPRTTMPPGTEWLTRRELPLEPVARTEPRPEERLCDTDIARLLGRGSLAAPVISASATVGGGRR